MGPNPTQILVDLARAYPASTIVSYALNAVHRGVEPLAALKEMAGMLLKTTDRLMAELTWIYQHSPAPIPLFPGKSAREAVKNADSGKMVALDDGERERASLVPMRTKHGDTFLWRTAVRYQVGQSVAIGREEFLLVAVAYGLRGDMAPGIGYIVRRTDSVCARCELDLTKFNRCVMNTPGEEFHQKIVCTECAKVLGNMRTCRHCGEAFGNHATDCPVKFRDETNPDPEAQKAHERLDEAYEAADVPEPDSIHYINPTDGYPVCGRRDVGHRITFQQNVATCEACLEAMRCSVDYPASQHSAPPRLNLAWIAIGPSLHKSGIYQIFRRRPRGGQMFWEISRNGVVFETLSGGADVDLDECKRIAEDHAKGSAG